MQPTSQITDTNLDVADGEYEKKSGVIKEVALVEGYSLNDAIDHIGFGMFQIKMVLVVGWYWTTDAMEMMVLSILSPVLKCEWNLTSLEEALITTMVFFGQAIGSYVWGVLSDKFGRKKGLNFSSLTVLVFGIASSQSPSYPWMLVFRFFVGFGIGGIPQAVTILLETLPSKHRGKGAMCLALFWSIGAVLAAVLALAIMSVLSWKWYLICITFPIIIFLLVGIWLPESPHFLLATGRYDEAVAVLQRIAYHNGKSLPKGKLLAGEINHKRGEITEIFSRQWFRTAVCLIVIWFTLAFIYYGAALLNTEMTQSGINGCHPYTQGRFSLPPEKVLSNVTQAGCHHLTNADYAGFVYTTLGEFPGIIAAFMLLDWIGRKKTLSTLFVSAAVFFLLLNVCTSKVLSLLFMFAIRGLASGTFQTAFVYTPEVLPTSIRAVGLGACSMFARIGAMITPFVAQVLIHKSLYLVNGLYALFLVLCAVVSALLPIETKGTFLQSSSTNSLIAMKNGYRSL